jgi:hypothetical protein
MLLKARAEGDSRRCAVVATVVSSSAVGKMAEMEGFEFHQTATGFKNIGLKGHELKQQVRLRPPSLTLITSNSRPPPPARALASTRHLPFSATFLQPLCAPE